MNPIMLRQVITQASKKANNILGLNIDPDLVLITYANISGVVYEKLLLKTQGLEDFQSLLEFVSAQSDKLLMLTKAQRLPLPDLVSVAIAGNYDPSTGFINGDRSFPKWKQESIKSQLGLKFNLPIHIEQKSIAGALAESLFGSPQTPQSLVYLNMTPFLEAGIISGGRIYRSPGGSGGSVGRIRIDQPDSTISINSNTLDDYASGIGLTKFAKLSQPSHWNPDADIDTIITAALEEDPYALELFGISARGLGEGLVPIIHLLRPEKIIIGYPFHLLGDIYALNVQQAVLETSLLSTPEIPLIAVSQLGKRLPELQALAPAIASLRNYPL